MSEPTNSQFPDLSKSNVQPEPSTKPTAEPTKQPDSKPVEAKSADKPVDSKAPIEVDFSEFTNLTGEESTPAINTEVEAKKDAQPHPLETKPKDTTVTPSKSDDKKPEDKKVETTVKPEDKEIEEAVKEVTQDIRQSKKDFTDIDPADIPYFSKMGLKSFERLKPVYLAEKKLRAEAAEKDARIEKLSKGALPDSYYEHPQAYTLTKEFEQVANTYSKAQIIAQHWNDQLDKIKRGDETYQEIHINPQTNEFYYSKPVTATKESESEIASYLKGSEAQLNRIGASVQALATTHQSKSQEAVKALKDWENTAFAKVSTKEMEPIIKDTIAKILPPAFHNSPLAAGYAKSLLVIQQLGTLLKQLQETKGNGTTPTNGDTTTAKVIEEDKRKAGPNINSMASGGTESGKDEVTIEDFDAVIGRR